ncbi:hypothetical protein Tco_0494045 [Tanacetum coccineum]
MLILGTEDLDDLFLDGDDVSIGHMRSLANLSNYGFDVILEVPHSDSYHNDMDNQSVHAMQDFEQTSVVDFSNDESTLVDSKYDSITRQYFAKKNKLAAVQDTNLQTQQDSMILSVIEQMSKQMINHKAQPIKPTLYDGSVISEKHVVMPVIDDEETLILEELNKLSEDFRKRFVPQQELSAEQAFWFHMSNPTTESSDASPVKVEVPCELPKVSLVNESLKKLKFHLAKFDSVVKKRTTPDALTEDVKHSLLNVNSEHYCV